MDGRKHDDLDFHHEGDDGLRNRNAEDMEALHVLPCTAYVHAHGCARVCVLVCVCVCVCVCGT